jgi:hypothetical protein
MEMIARIKVRRELMPDAWWIKRGYYGERLQNFVAMA